MSEVGELPTAEAPTPVETFPSVQKFLGIVKTRLERIASQPRQETSQENPQQPENKEEERRNTAQALLNILNASEKPTDSFKTTIKPIEDQPSQETKPAPSEDSSQKPATDEQAPTQEKPQLVTYTNPRIATDENGHQIIITTDPQGKEVKFSTSRVSR